MDKLANLNKIGEGQESEVYSLEDSKVLKLFRNYGDDQIARREMEILKIIYQNGIHTPKVYEYVNVSSRPGYIMERIYGSSIISIIEKKPYLILSMSRIFAKAHFEIHRLDTQIRIPSLKEELNSHIKAVNCLEDEIKEYTFKLLRELPDGNCICHGDYNPSNVVINAGNPMFLDWGGVSIGDSIADVAHTLLILKNGQFPPDTAPHFKAILKLGRKNFANLYFNSYRKYTPVDLSVLSKWEMVRAVGRLGYGGNEEKPALLKFIKKFYINRKNDRIVLF